MGLTCTIPKSDLGNSWGRVWGFDKRPGVVCVSLVKRIGGFGRKAAARLGGAPLFFTACIFAARARSVRRAAAAGVAIAAGCAAEEGGVGRGVRGRDYAAPGSLPLQGSNTQQ